MKSKELISILEMFDPDLEVVLVCDKTDYPTGSTDRVMEGDDGTVLIFSEAN